MPVLGLREPDGNDIEIAISNKISASVGIALTTIEASLDDECSKFRRELFDTIEAAEKIRSNKGTLHYAFHEAVVLRGFAINLKPEGSEELYETDLDELEISGSIKANEERAMERLKRKIETAGGAAHVWYRPTEKDEYAFVAPINQMISRDIMERTPAELVDLAMEYLKNREGVEVSFVFYTDLKSIISSFPTKLPNSSFKLLVRSLSSRETFL